MKKLQRVMRRSALLGPWGVGAIVPFPNSESLMIAGLDEWRYPADANPFVIRDDRLTKRLGVSELRWPPDYREPSADPKNCNLTIPAVRFPTWYYCPFCGQMKKTTYYEVQPTCDAIQWTKGRKCPVTSRFKKKMIPERFIVICPEGHIDDFPVAEWVHYGSGHAYDPDTCVIRRSTGGASANLSGVTYECTCGAKNTMSGVMVKGALKRIDYRCKATKPWLGRSGEEVCEEEPENLKVVLRGATNVWFADTISSITLPKNDSMLKRIQDIADKYCERVKTRRVGEPLDRDRIADFADYEKVDPEILYQAISDRYNSLRGNLEVSENMTEDEYRFQEYRVLCKSSGNDRMDFHSINYPIAEYDPVIHEYFDSISLVPKLRETRAFIGFSRVEPISRPVEERKKELRLGTTEDWLPAIEVYGEGIFFQFNSAKLREWAAHDDVKERIARLNQACCDATYLRGMQGNLSAEYVLIHTFAHLIINQLSFECGYGSSSIRERIYCQRISGNLNMYGLLIYTASGDSEGSLGGLVRQGEKGRLENTILNAIKNATWCTSDPICIQSSGQGPESLNLAACHNCALLPETCCENGNRLLDRGVVVGTLEKLEMGYFSSLRDI